MSAKAARRRPTRPRPRSNGRSRSASCMRCSRSRSTCSSARAATGDAKATVDGDRRRPISTPSSARSRGAGQRAALRREERRQDAAGRRPMAAQGRQSSTISSSPTTRPRRRSRSAARWSRSADGRRAASRGPARARPCALLEVHRVMLLNPGLSKASARSSWPMTSSLSVGDGRGARHHRPERRRQDDAVQPDHRRISRRRRRHSVSTVATSPAQAARALPSPGSAAPTRSRNRSRI